jgi:hypothetical protein
MFTFPLMVNGWQVHPLINLSSCGTVLQVNLLQLSEGTLQMSTRSGEFFFNEKNNPLDFRHSNA